MSFSYYENTSFGMGTLIEHKISAESPAGADWLFHETGALLQKLEAEMSYFLPRSDVSQLNSCDGNAPVTMGAATFEVLKAANTFYRLSGGAFDVTTAPLTALWRACISTGELPADEEIQRLRPLVGGSRLELDEKKHTVKIGHGQSVDLGGIGKGFAADMVKEAYQKSGVTSAFVNLGGNVNTLGAKTNGGPWMIGLQDPRNPRGNFIAGLAVADRSAVTSGDYEKCFEAHGKRYHHIIDPKTGYPADSDLMSATVLSPSSMEADALSTAVFVLGLRDGMELIGKIPQAEAVLVTKEKTVFLTKGLQNSFTVNGDGHGYRFCVYD